MTKHPEFVVIPSTIILNDKNEVLLGKRAALKAFPGKWGIPGGKVELTDLGQDILETTLKRECMEELGIEIGKIQYIESSAHETERGMQMFIIFSSRIQSGEPQPLEDTDEVKWWSVDELVEDELTPGIYHNIKKALSID